MTSGRADYVDTAPNDQQQVRVSVSTGFFVSDSKFYQRSQVEALKKLYSAYNTLPSNFGGPPRLCAVQGKAQCGPKARERQRMRVILACHPCFLSETLFPTTRTFRSWFASPP